MIDYPDLTEEEQRLRAILSDRVRLEKLAKATRAEWEQGRGKEHVERCRKEIGK